jgi:hypothetical protein
MNIKKSSQIEQRFSRLSAIPKLFKTIGIRAEDANSDGLNVHPSTDAVRLLKNSPNNWRFSWCFIICATVHFVC